MHHVDLIMTLTGGLAAALVLGYITQRLGLSPIVGYLIAGVAVGPFTPGFVADQEMSKQLAEIGVILLMFGVGLHFHLEDLMAVRKVALPGAIGQSLVATGLGAWIAHSFGWSWEAGIVYGIALSVASTVVLLRVLTDNRDLHTNVGHISVGWLIVEDLFTVVVLVLMPAVVRANHAGDGAAEAAAQLSLPMALGWATVKIGLLVVLTLILGGKVIPWLLHRVAVTRSRELFTLTVLVVAMGIAVGSARLFGVSMELGAFLAGMVVGRSEFSARAASEALPMRDAFAVLFFVSVGMLFDPKVVTEMPGQLAATVAAIMIGKPVAALVIVLALRYPLRVALSVAAVLSQIGEFSFILAHLGQDLGVLPKEATNLLVGAAILSITLNPLLYRGVKPLERWLSARPFVSRWLPAPAAAQNLSQHVDDGDGVPNRHRAVVVGYGPVGKTLTRLLQENGIRPTIIELNVETVRRLREQGIQAVYGDASQREILLAAGIKDAGSLILSSSGLPDADAVIRLARELQPDIRVLARTAYVRELEPLRDAGATLAISGEGEVALALIEAVLRPLGATPEQIDRERERFRSEVLPDRPPVATPAAPAAPAPATPEPAE